MVKDVYMVSCVHLPEQVNVFRSVLKKLYVSSIPCLKSLEFSITFQQPLKYMITIGQVIRMCAVAILV